MKLDPPHSRIGWPSFILALLAVSLYAMLTLSSPVYATPERPVVLVLVDGLTWNEVEEVSALSRTFDGGGAANLSTAQGSTPDDGRYGYIFLGAGARVDTAVLPEKLPRDRGELAQAFGGPASTVKPGLLGETLAHASIETAAIGKDAELVTMDDTGNTARTYNTGDPEADLNVALSDGAEFVAIKVEDPQDAGRASQAARKAGATVAIASPNAPSGSGDLTPLALSGEEGVLYSPTTRTEALISNADVAPTLLSELGVEPPDTMQGRPAIVRAGANETTERFGDRLAFVANERFEVWIIVGMVSVLALAIMGYFRGRIGLSVAVLGVASLPVGALLAATVPLTNTFVVAALTVLFATVIAGISWSITVNYNGMLAGVCLATATLVAVDAAMGGTLMKLSTLGYNPAYGARFYGIGNEYSAILAGSLTMGLGAFASRRRIPLTLLLATGTVSVLALGLPTMGADVGGSLALGVGVGATVAFLRGEGLRGWVLWAGGGFSLASVLFVLTGIFFPDVSHGSRAAGGGGGLVEIAVRKLILSAEHFTNPLQVLLLVAGLILIHAGWRQASGTLLAAGILGATVTALASGALNDSGILATLFALVYPATAALGVLLTGEASYHQRRVR